jgi:acyl-CoA reductase-like NAD-dependent aldehyde dehydrogenase
VRIRISINRRFDIVLNDYKGQSRVAGSRIFVQEGIYDDSEFLKEFTSTAAHLTSKTGDPFEQGTEHGPQVSKVHFDVCPCSMDCTFV